MEKIQETLPSNSINKLPIQPLVSNISTKICNLAKHVAKLLSPLSQTYALLIAQNSSQNKLKTKKFQMIMRRYRLMIKHYSQAFP